MLRRPFSRTIHLWSLGLALLFLVVPSLVRAAEPAEAVRTWSARPFCVIDVSEAWPLPPLFGVEAEEALPVESAALVADPAPAVDAGSPPPLPVQEEDEARVGDEPTLAPVFFTRDFDAPVTITVIGASSHLPALSGPKVDLVR